MVYIIVILVAAIIGIGIWCWYKINKVNEQVISKNKELRDKEVSIDRLKGQLELLDAENSEMRTNLVSKDINEQSIQKDSETLAFLEEKLCNEKEKLAQLEAEFGRKNSELNEKLGLSQEERVKTEKELGMLHDQISAATQEIQVANDELLNLKNLLEDLKNRHRLVILDAKNKENSIGIKFIINDKEKLLINALDKVCDMFPELSRDMRKIEWEKIWRPQIQRYRSELSGKQGIYKLTLIEDENICYIGQARDIYDRWFDHMKKMIGMDAKGNERLYEYGIGDFYWGIQEEVEDSSRLNEAEKYWIEYFGCVEIGLNKKI